MVSREKVLEKRLDDVRTFVNALKIVLVAQLPTSLISALAVGFRIEVLIALVVCIIAVTGLLVWNLKVRERLFAEWGRDPVSILQEIITAVILGITAILIYLIVALF